MVFISPYKGRLRVRYVPGGWGLVDWRHHFRFCSVSVVAKLCETLEVPDELNHGPREAIVNF